LKEAGELGDAAAHYQLGCMYYIGEVVEKDLEMGIYHWEEAAMDGHPQARHYLAIIEGKNGNTERAVKHLIISANLGYEESMKEFWKHYYAGHIIKETLDATLRSHQSAIDATKSLQREEAEVIYQQMAASRR
jgi:TPR repeat protein